MTTTSARFQPDVVVRWRRSLTAYYVLMGFSGSIWSVRLPQIRIDLRASSWQLGLVGLCAAVGSLIGIAASHRIIQRFGTRAAMCSGYLVGPIAFLIEGYVTQARWSDGIVIVGIGYFINGVSFSCTDIAINVDGSSIERELNKSVLPSLHGQFSVGAVVGAAAGTFCAGIHESIFVQMSVVAALMFAIPFATYSTLQGRIGEHVGSKGEGRWRDLFDASLVILIACVFFFTVAEGAASSWLTLIVNEARHFSPVFAGVCLFAFSGAMTLMRLGSRRWAERTNPATILLSLGFVGLLGAAFVRFGTGHTVLFIGSVLWGAGIALAFPLSVSAAGRTGKNSSQRVVFVATAGYAAFLSGPPLLGLAAQKFGLLTIATVSIVMFVLAISTLLLSSKTIAVAIRNNADAS